MADFTIIVGRDKATITPNTQSARRWLFAVMAERNGIVTIDREFVDEIEEKLREEGWTADIH